MKKIFVSLIILYIMFFVTQFCFNFFKRNHIVDYKINDISIHEDYRGNIKDEKNNYFFEIKTQNNTFYSQTFENFKKEKKVIKDIKYFKNNEYECILPIFKDEKVVTDVMCMKDNQQYNYQEINNNEVKTFVETLKEYNLNNYKDLLTQTHSIGTTVAYGNNKIEDHILALTSYKGIKILQKTFKETEFFANDKYTQKVKGFIGDYYIVINYNENFEANEFIALNLKTREQKTIGSSNLINFDSYIQGVVGSSIYIFDNDTKSQYEIDVDTKNILKTGSTTTGIKYYDGTWTTKSAYDASQKEMLFKTYDSTDEYIRIDKVNGKEFGQVYYTKKVGNSYRVFKAYRNANQKIYLFTTTDYKTLKYIGDYVYYEYEDTIKYYSELTGSKTLLKDTEIKNNQTIDFYVLGD